jgi:hypothetical protein
METPYNHSLLVLLFLILSLLKHGLLQMVIIINILLFIGMSDKHISEVVKEEAFVKELMA